MIDWSRVEELREEVGAEDFDEVVTLFLSEVEERLAGFEATAQASVIEEDMHFLKGSALNLGFSDLAKFCGKGEALAARGETMEKIEQVSEVYQKSKTVFLNALGGSAAA